MSHLHDQEHIYRFFLFIQNDFFFLKLFTYDCLPDLVSLHCDRWLRPDWLHLCPVSPFVFKPHPHTHYLFARVCASSCVLCPGVFAASTANYWGPKVEFKNPSSRHICGSPAGLLIIFFFLKQNKTLRMMKAVSRVALSFDNALD